MISLILFACVEPPAPEVSTATPSTVPAPTPTPTPTPTPAPPIAYTLEAADLGVFCEGWVDGTCYNRLPPAVLAPGELVFARVEQSEIPGYEPDREQARVVTSTTNTIVYTCSYLADVDGVRYCAAEVERGLGDYEVGPLDDPETRWPLGRSPFFFGCDPDGDGTQALCTGSGYDEPPLDGVFEAWSADVPEADHAIDRPGLEPVLWENHYRPEFAIPELANAQATRTLAGQVDGRDVLVATEGLEVRLTDVQPPYASERVALPVERRMNVVGRFLSSDTTVLLSLGREDQGGAVVSLDGTVLGELAVGWREAEWSDISALVVDLDGDGLDELVHSDGPTIYAFRLVPAP